MTEEKNNFFPIKRTLTDSGYGSFFVIEKPEGDFSLDKTDSNDVYQVEITTGTFISCVVQVRHKVTDEREGAWEDIVKFNPLDGSSLLISASDGLMIRKDELLSTINRKNFLLEELRREESEIQKKMTTWVEKNEAIKKKIDTNLEDLSHLEARLKKRATT